MRRHKVQDETHELEECYKGYKNTMEISLFLFYAVVDRVSQYILMHSIQVDLKR